MWTDLPAMARQAGSLMRPKLYPMLLCLMIASIDARHPAAAVETKRACIMCTEPDRNYLCAVIPPETGTMALSPPLYCAREIARKNGHPSCAIIRANTDQCTGKTIILAYAGPITPPDQAQASIAPETAPIPDKKGPPKTLLEATDRLVANSEKEIRKAGVATTETAETIKNTGMSVGEKVLNTVKMTVNCVITLFQSCD